MQEFCFIVIDYHSYLRTIKFLKDLSSLCEGKVKVVVVDNSNENMNFENLVLKASEEFGPYINVSQKEILIKSDEIEILFLNSNKNLGFARGNNYGAEFACKYWEFKYFIFSNNDIVFEKLNFGELTCTLNENSNIGIMGIKQLDLNGENQNPRRNVSIWRKIILPNFFSLFMNSKMVSFVINDKLDLNIIEEKVLEVDWVSGAFMIVRKQSFNEVCGFDPNTFLYGEELILSQKIREIDKKVIYNSKNKIVHEHGGTTVNHSNLFIEKENFKSHYYFYKNYIKVSSFELFMANLAFNVHRTINFPMKQKLKKLLVK